MHIHLPDERIPEILQAMLNDPNCGTIYRIKGALPLKQNRWLSINLTQKKAELQTVSNGQSVLIVIEHRLQNLRNSFIRQVDMHEIMHFAVALDVVCNLSDRHIFRVSILCFQVCV